MRDYTPIESLTIDEITITKGMELYYARIIPRVGLCYAQTLMVRTIYEDSIVGIDTTTKTAPLINLSSLGRTLFTRRKSAEKLVKETLKSGVIREMKNEE